MLSNSELKELLSDENPIVKNFIHQNDGDVSSYSLQPASIDLHVGEIIVPSNDGSESKKSEYNYIIPSGGSVVVLTREEINFPPNYCGIMFPKSSKLAERGILLTNCGHVDPGYVGKLRYAVINLGREGYCIRVNDSFASLCVFRLRVPANPDWSVGRIKSSSRTLDFVRALSPDLLSINKITEAARSEADRVVCSSSVRMVLFSLVVSVSIGVVSVAATLGVSWFCFVQPRLDGMDKRIDFVSNVKAGANLSGQEPSRKLLRRSSQ